MGRVLIDTMVDSPFAVLVHMNLIYEVETLISSITIEEAMNIVSKREVCQYC